MAHSVIDSTLKQSTDGSNVTTDAMDTTGADLLVAVVATFGGSGTITDSKGNTWTARTQYGTTDATVRIYYAENPTVGSGHTFTLSSSGKAPTLAVIAVSGAALSSAFDQENGTASVATGTTRQPGSVTPSEDNELLILASSYYSAGFSSVDSSFTAAEHVNAVGGVAMGLALAYKIQTTAGAENPTITFDAPASSVAAIATFKAAAGGGVSFIDNTTPIIRNILGSAA